MVELTCQELFAAPFGLDETLLVDTPTDLAAMEPLLWAWYVRATRGGTCLIYLRDPALVQAWAGQWFVDFAEVARDEDAAWYELRRATWADRYDQVAAFTGETREQVVVKCHQGIQRTKEVWEAADTATPEAREAFYASTDAYLYELIGHEPPIPPMTVQEASGARHFELAHGTGGVLIRIGHFALIDGYDVSEVTRAFVRFRIARFYPQVIGRARVLDDWEDLPPGSYDVVHAYHVLEHLEDPLAALHKLVALLRPGGEINAIAPFEAIGPEYPEHNPALAHLTVPGLFEQVGVRLTGQGKIGVWDAYSGVWDG